MTINMQSKITVYTHYYVSKWARLTSTSNVKAEEVTALYPACFCRITLFSNL